MRKLLLLLGTNLLFLSAIAQNRTITGRVVDPKGVPLGSVSVTPSDNSSAGGTTTNPAGVYTITVPSSLESLRFSSIGFADQVVNIANRTSIDVTMSSKNAVLDEVVVVGYGQQSRSKITGAVTTLKAAEVENIPMPSVDQILQGKVAGLQSVSATGQPGSAQQIRIRGIGSITASASPLFIIDGIPVNTGDYSNATNSANTLAGINPTDIETVTVLKDAASTSIYGSRGANGVIVITTKRGKSGKPVIRLDAEYGMGQIAFLPEKGRPLSRSELEELTREGLVNGGFTEAQITGQLAALGFNSTADYDWLDIATRSSKTEQLNLSSSGGDANTQYYISGGYFKQEGIFLGSDFTRYSGAFNIRQKIGNKLTINPSVNFSFSNQTGESESSNFRNPVIASALLRPTQEAYKTDGTPNYDVGVFNQVYNPLAIAEYDKRRNNGIKVLAGIEGQYQILDRLRLSSKFGLDFLNLEESLFYNPFFGDARTTQGFAYGSASRALNYIWTNTLDYGFGFLGGLVNGNAKLGYESQNSKAYEQTSSGTGLPLTFALGYPNATTPTAQTFTGSDYSFISQFAALDLGYKGKYTLSGTFRRDGSSRFGIENQYANFWSVGAAWNISSEDFLKDNNVLSLLRLRASYGTNGNAEIGNYAARPLYSFGGLYNYGGIAGSAPTAVGNNKLTWEISKPFNVGIDLGLWKDRINLVADYYIRATESLLLDVPLSRTSGFSTTLDNVGSMENRGLELTLNSSIVRSADVQWNASFNITFNKNKVTGLFNNAEFVAAPFLRRVGEDFQSVYTPLYAGVDPDNGNALFYTDSTRSATTTDLSQAERVIIGSGSPKGYGGFSTDVTFKNFTLDAQVNFVYGNTINDQWAFITLGDGAYGSFNHYRAQLQRWQKPGDVTNVPAYVYGNSTNSNGESSRYYYKGDYMRLRYLTLSYNLPRAIMSKVKMQKASLYVRGTNLFTKAFDKDITIDPEQGITGVSNLRVPPQRIVSVGINLSF
jgi:TonB-linked SusC/RagA family outer membrane protein